MTYVLLFLVAAVVCLVVVPACAWLERREDERDAAAWVRFIGGGQR